MFKTLKKPDGTASTFAGTIASYDPYQLQFTFCPSGIDIDLTSTANKYFGFPEGYEILDAKQSVYPPVDLYGPPCINVWTNFTMNNIPVSEFLCCVPINTSYGGYIHFSNYDNSMSTLSLEKDINNIRVILKDDKGDLLDYPSSLHWDIILSMQATIPEGFEPLEM
jgi:hypothetical protein